MSIFLRRARASLALSAVGIGLAASMPALADEAPAAQPAQANETSEIIVTAQRRSESIQSVPMTLQALSGNTLSQLNISNFSDLLKYTPNVTFGTSGPGQGVIFMRGLSGGVPGTQGGATMSTFPNVAIYLDDQSMQFPSRNADIYMADMSRVEVLEGPQGTLFGGGAEAGAVRYITNKPRLDKFEGHIEGSFGGTAGGAPNGAFNATINIPIIKDQLAIRATVYDDHHGGYIDNVPSSFTRRATDSSSSYIGFTPSATNQANGGVYNNANMVKNNYNPVDYTGGRIEALWDITPDWNLLVSESYQKIDAEGTFSSYPTGSDGQALGSLQTTTFIPSYNKDTYWNTAWAVNGKIGDWKLTYTGAYMTRHIDQQQDYTNYSRHSYTALYQCSGSSTGWTGTGGNQTYCYSPQAYWNENTRNTHHSEELRIASPENKRLRFIGGAYYEQFKVYDVTRYYYQSIPGCTGTLIAAGQACAGALQPVPGFSASQPGLEPSGVAFGQDVQRGYRQLAFFGSADFDILPNLTLTGGTRYYNYKEYENGSTFISSAAACNGVAVCTVPTSGGIDAGITYHGFRSRGVLTWKPRAGTMVYALFSQGFRPGGFNRRSSSALGGQFLTPLAYTPDTLTNWEIGVKTDLLDHKATFNLSAYYMVWQNMQMQFSNPDGGFGPLGFVTNGANFHVKGIEAQLALRPFAGLTINASATYNKSTQVSQPCFVSNVPSSSSYGQCITTYRSAPVQSPFGNLGSSLPFSPSFQGNLRARYEWQGRAGLTWFTGGGVSYTGPMWDQPSTYASGEGVTQILSPLLRYHMSGYALLDASLGFRRDQWTVSIFGENLGNSHASTFTSSTQFIKAEVPVRPLTYGVKLGVNF